MKTEAKAHRVNQTSNDQFGCRILSVNLRHALTALFRCEGIGHDCSVSKLVLKLTREKPIDFELNAARLATNN